MIAEPAYPPAAEVIPSLQNLQPLTIDHSTYQSFLQETVRCSLELCTIPRPAVRWSSSTSRTTARINTKSPGRPHGFILSDGRSLVSLAAMHIDHKRHWVVIPEIGIAQWDEMTLIPGIWLSLPYICLTVPNGWTEFCQQCFHPHCQAWDSLLQSLQLSL